MNIDHINNRFKLAVTVMMIRMMFSLSCNFTTPRFYFLYEIKVDRPIYFDQIAKVLFLSKKSKFPRKKDQK